MIASYILFMELNPGNKVYNKMITETLVLRHIGRVHAVFHGGVILFTCSAPQVSIKRLYKSNIL